MILLRIAAATGAAAMLAGCGAAPEKSIEQDCVRITSVLAGDAAPRDNACSCFAGGLKEKLSKADLKTVSEILQDPQAENGIYMVSRLAEQRGMEAAARSALSSTVVSCF